MRHEHNNTSSSSSTHRDKRLFQPSITTFFARFDSDELDFDSCDERGPDPLSRTHLHREQQQQAYRTTLVPTVPERVQADLLSVGMRVRKSVPEGYKTHKTATTASLPTIQTTLVKDTYSVKPPQEAVAEGLLHQRELLPFCGLHRIGGFAEQPVTNTHLYEGTDENGDRPVNMFPLPAQAFNQPFSSQSSTDSASSIDSMPPNPLNVHKRGWQEEEGAAMPLNSNFLFALPMKVSEDEVPISPHSETPTQNFNALPQAALRPFAQPKTRRSGGRMMEVDMALFKDPSMDIDLENADSAAVQPNSVASDFGEADFLRPWSGSEVEMGGV